MTLTYVDGTPIQVGDVVRRSKTSKATYRVGTISCFRGLEPIITLHPHSGYTSASAFGTYAIAALVKVVDDQ